MSIFDKLTQFLPNREDDFVRLNRKDSSTFGPGPCILLINCPKTICDEEYIAAEMENIKQVFEDNGYEIVNAMKETQPDDEEKPKEEAVRGIVVMPNVPGFTEKFNKIARKHRFRIANKAVRDMKAEN